MTTFPVVVSPIASNDSAVEGTSSNSTASTGQSRRISPEVGRALEMLGHAIEYLADEFALECRNRVQSPYGKDGHVAAIETLMACNRKLYLECPLEPTTAERLRNIFRFRRSS